jgi:hypothetical protein
VLVFDFGGGTLDVTVMRIGNPATRAVLATGGLPVAGDVFDQRIVRRKLARLFGEGTMYGPPARRVPLPTWLYDALADWQEIVTLQQPENRAILEDILSSAEQPQGLRHLIELAARNYGLALYTAVEGAKRQLSDAAEARIEFSASTFAIGEPLSRREFELLIEDETLAVESLLMQVVRAAGLTPVDIDAVVRTGGSSRIPVFVQMLQRLFGADKVRSLDLFSSVTAGLAVAAHRIEAGELVAEAYARDPRSGATPDTAPAESRVPAVAPGFLSDWVAAQEQAAVAPNARIAATWLTADYRLMARELPGFAPDGREPAGPHQTGIGAVRPNQAVLSGLDDQLVLLTSTYRLLLTSPRQLLVLAHNEMALAQIHDFEHGEVVSALGLWDEVRAHDQLALLSGRGILRVADMDLVRSRLDRAIPWRLEMPPESDPVALAGLQRDQSLALVTSTARALRLAVPAGAVRGVATIKRGKDERIVGCLPLHDADQILLAAPDGTASRLSADQVPVATAPNAPGKVVVRNLAVRSAVRVSPDAQPWVLTSRFMRPAALAQAVSGDQGRRFRLVNLEGDEQVLALVMPPAALS